MLEREDIGVRELREQLTRVLVSVQHGRSIVVTNHGRPIARIEPMHADATSETRRLLEQGVVSWGGGRLEPLDPEPLVGAGPSVADILLAQRGNKPNRPSTSGAARRSGRRRS